MPVLIWYFDMHWWFIWHIFFQSKYPILLSILPFSLVDHFICFFDSFSISNTILVPSLKSLVRILIYPDILSQSMILSLLPLTFVGSFILAHIMNLSLSIKPIEIIYFFYTSMIDPFILYSHINIPLGVVKLWI